jgi:hypothetical protein
LIASDHLVGEIAGDSFGNCGLSSHGN